ncbi:unnamed protein product [Psylliodes chrysocephalus]|uniref:CCHC-type domain-containing protein n=1 Tax=Psylliodes chrysocephalus TaxID=3402493 RepID=A0A9P0CXK1_9CUCU|nr:unnamed protein product [Psylliodes chrysocephala]
MKETEQERNNELVEVEEVEVEEEEKEFSISCPKKHTLPKTPEQSLADLKTFRGMVKDNLTTKVASLTKKDLKKVDTAKIAAAAAKHSRLNFIEQGRRCNSVSFPDTQKKKILDMTLDTSGTDHYKQKESPEAFTLNEAIDKNIKLVKIIKGLIEDAPNTHKKIKEVVKIRNANEFQRDSFKKWLNKKRFEPIEKIMYDVDFQTIETPKKTCEIATQTEPWHGQATKVTLKYLDGIEKFEEYEEIETMEWDQTLYKNTEVVVGNPIMTEDKTTKVVFGEPNDPTMSNGIQKLYSEKYLALLSLSGEFEVIEQITKTKSKNELSQRKIIRATHDGTTKSVWRKLKEIREETSEDGKVAIHHLTNITTTNLRKMAETVFHNSNTKVEIYTTARKKEDEKVRTTYGMIVSEGGKSYREVLMKVKDVVKKNSSAAAIRSVKSTKDGKLLLTLDKDDKAITNLQKAFKENTSGLRTRRLGMDNFSTIHIRGMEADATVKEAIKDAVGTWEEDNKLSELRPLSNDTLAATLTLRTEQAEKLLREGFLRVGLGKCRLEKRLNIRRCPKCWSYEQEVDKCEGPDRSKQCFKCGLEDHSAKECTNEEHALFVKRKDNNCIIQDVSAAEDREIESPNYVDDPDYTPMEENLLQNENKDSSTEDLSSGNNNKKSDGKQTDKRKRKKVAIPEEWDKNINKKKRMLGQKYVGYTRNKDGTIKHNIEREQDFKTKAEVFNLYKKICLDEEILPLTIYPFLLIFDQKKLALFKLWKDQCDDVCCAYKMKQLDEDSYNKHKLAKNQARKEKDEDKIRCKNKEIYCFTMDVQAVKLCPKLEASALYYKTKLQVHNFTIYNLESHDSKNYLWNETEGELCSSVFATCIFKHIQTTLDREVRSVVLYSDSCGYQNKNKYLASALCLLACKNNVEIEHKYLVKGHTQMECDATHSLIERHIKARDIYLPTDYISVITSARQKPQPLQVEYLNHSYFFNFDDNNILRYDSIRPGNRVNDPKVADISCLKYLPNGNILYKLNYNEAYLPLPQRSQTINHNYELKPLYQTRLKITKKSEHTCKN